MNVTRDVIIDLLPVYLGGEASPATRALIEEYLKQDPELAQRIRSRWAENLASAAPSGLPPELELRSLQRTRRILFWQRWTFAIAIAFTAVAFSVGINFEHGRVTDVHFMLRDYPLGVGACLIVALFCWAIYYVLRRRLRATSG
jgi:predicted anti-sigma-YlaC factor YlaD